MNQIPKSRAVLYGVVTVLAAVVDLVSKEVVFRQFELNRGSEWLLDGWLKFRLFTSLNRGALWGIGQGFALGFALLSVVALLGIWYWLFARGACRSAWLTSALALISGGILGNLYDRLGIHGLQEADSGKTILAVRDFLDFRLGTFDWAVFNVADVCLVTGAAMLMLQSLTAPQETPLTTADKDAARSGQA